MRTAGNALPNEPRGSARMSPIGRNEYVGVEHDSNAIVPRRAGHRQFDRYSLSCLLLQHKRVHLRVEIPSNADANIADRDRGDENAHYAGNQIGALRADEPVEKARAQQ